MRWLIAGLTVLWGLFTVGAYVIVLPFSRSGAEMAEAYFLAAAEAPKGEAAALIGRYLSARGEGAKSPSEVLALGTDERAAEFARFIEWHDAQGGTKLSDSPRLTWSTDDNPARRVQCRLFRTWHLVHYGTPLDIATDPSNRDITKTIVQCVAGAGPDVIEAYGPAELGQFVLAGVAQDVTERARAEGFGVERVFAAAASSMCVDERQYAFPCNVGYVVLFYHRDLFRQAGVPEPPAKGWTIAEMTDASKRLMAADPSGRRVGIMGMSPWPMSLAEGAHFFNEDGTASFFNSPASVGAFRSYQDLMYREKVMPSPAEAASMASSGGANMNADAASASASALFAAKATAMVTDGRWAYVGLASRNRDRVIRPAVEGRIAALKAGAPEQRPGEAALLHEAMESLSADVLVPIRPEQMELVRATLRDEDRSRLIELGVAHVPTTSGTPWYESAARVAIVNRASPRAELASRFLRFLASEEYNEQINQTFDSICGMPEYCEDSDGISGPPEPLPGLEAFDSPVFVDAMAKYAHPWELSPFIGRGRLGILTGPVLEGLTNNTIGPGEAARVIEQRINEQIHANLVRDNALRSEWERRVGKAFDPSRGVKEQVIGARGGER